MRQLRPDYATWQDPHTSVVVSFPVPSSDGGVVKALRAGHPGAIRALTERYSADLLRIASRILGPDAMIESVVTRALRRALARIDRLEDATRFRTWLTSQVVRATKRRLRLRRYGRWLQTSRFGNNLIGKDPNAEEPRRPTEPRFSELLLASYRVLDRMNDDQRIVFCLVTLHAMSLAETATVLEIPLIKCRTLLDRACADFMRHCQREPIMQRLTEARETT
jgi:RNA polymerase sigma-70 factor, ECF subfamily